MSNKERLKNLEAEAREMIEHAQGIRETVTPAPDIREAVLAWCDYEEQLGRRLLSILGVE